MIYYYSAEGNSEWVAKQIANGTGDSALSITEILKKGSVPPTAGAGEYVGIVFPVYAWSAPKIVTDFIKKLKVDEGAFIYAVCTMGGSAGNTMPQLRRHIRLDACYSVIMPDTYIVMYDTPSEGQIRAKVAAAKAEIPFICKDILEKKSVNKVKKGPFPALLSYIAAPLFRRFAGDKKLRADEKCIGCGVCAEVCPLSNIELSEGKPRWKGNCMQCCACIHSCPQEAVQHGKATSGRRRYLFKDEYAE